MGAAAAAWPVAAEAVSLLSSANEFWLGVGVGAAWRWVFFAHALFCVPAGREFKNRWLVHLLLTYLWGNGGGLITALLIQTPAVAPLSFFQDDFMVLAWIAAWWLVNWAPGGYVEAAVELWPVKLLLKSATMLLRALLITARVDLAVQLFPGVAAAPLILGSIAGCGGRLLADGVISSWESLPGYAELTSPGFVSRSAALAACSYYGLAYAARLLPAHAAAGLVVSALMLHCLASELSGRPLDFTEPITRLLHTITLVPLPPLQPLLAPGQAAAPRGGRSSQQGAARRKQQQPQQQPATPAKSTPAKKSGAAAAPKSPGSARNAATPAASPAKPPASPAAAPATASKPKQRGGSKAAAAAAAVTDAGGVATRRSQRRAAPAYA